MRLILNLEEEFECMNTRKANSKERLGDDGEGTGLSYFS